MQTVLILRHTKLECWQHKFAGILSFARNHGWQLQTVDCSNGRINPAEILKFWKPDGCILEADGDRSPFSPKFFDKTPLVCLDHSPKAIDAGASVVRHDSAAIARLAAHELLSTSFPYAAIVGWRRSSYWQTDKLKAFREIVSLHGKPIFEFLIDTTKSQTETVIHRQLRKWLSDLPRPCGIFGVNDLVAGHILNAACELGLAVPQEIAVIGADDDPLICESTRPTMSSVRPNFQKSGLVAAELLHDRMNSSGASPKLAIINPICIVRRQSTRLPSLSDTQVRNALELIRVEARNGLTAAKVLSSFSCSRRRAEIRFRETVGHTVMEEIQRIRFENALGYLHQSDLPLGAIADFSGWPSTLVLSRYAKSKTGKTLSQLRQSLT